MMDYQKQIMIYPDFRLYGLEPDRSVTGGAWYTDQEFESEFVEILNQQSYNYLYEKLEKSRQAGSNTGPMAARSMSMATSKEVVPYSNLDSP